MRTPRLLLILACILAGCSRSPELPSGVSLSVAPSGDVIITLDEGHGVHIRQNKPDPRAALVAYLDGKLQIVQLEQGGNVPRSMNLISHDGAEFSIMAGADKSRVLILDEDGDGLPDIKIEDNKKFKRANIEWTEIAK